MTGFYIYTAQSKKVLSSWRTDNQEKMCSRTAIKMEKSSSKSSLMTLSAP